LLFWIFTYVLGSAICAVFGNFKLLGFQPVPIDPEMAKKIKNHKKLKMPDTGSKFQ